jgi:putative transposase
MEIKEQVIFESADPESLSAPEQQTIVTELNPEGKVKLEVIQSLLEPCDRVTYGQRLRDGAQKLEISVRSVQRLFKKYQEQGLIALITTERADRGQHRISTSWQEFIVNTYKTGNKGSRRMTPKQVAIQVQAQAIKLNDSEPPSYRTVLRVIAPIQERAAEVKSIRSPGWRGSTLSVKTRDGYNLDINHSNQVWQSDHTRLDVMLVDRHGIVIGRPWLTTVIDSYSRALIGINVGFDAPSSQVVALALRHAILPKVYEATYRLHTEWITYGKPEYLFTDGGKDFRSNHITEIGTQLGFVHKLRDRPSEGGIVERFFGTLNESVLRALPGYTGSNVQQRPKDAEKDAQLTLRDIERIIVGFIVDKHNQALDARMGDQTRNQRWEAGLIGDPPLISERELDICLMKTIRRTVQRGGNVQFENVMYQGEYLAGYAGKTVSIRYDPRDITTMLRNKLQQTGRQTPVVPVVYLMPPSKGSSKDFFTSILEYLKYRAVKGTVSDFRSRAMDVLKACEVEMLIVDEADRLQPDTFPEVRDISDKLGIAVVLVGTDRLDAVIKRDEQVHNRFRAQRRFGKLLGQEFKDTVTIWENKVIALPVPSNLAKVDTQKLLLKATGGYIGRLDEILREAAIKSLSRGHKKIEFSILQEVAREYT